MWSICKVFVLVGMGLLLTYCAESESPEESAEPGSAPQAGRPPPGGAQDTERPPAFAELDVDGDGGLSPEETRRVPELREIFSLADRDRDGQLSIAEFSTATLEGTRVAPEAARGPLFPEVDRDENGRITPEEARAIPQLADNFATFDADESGGIDVHEYADAVERGALAGAPSDGHDGHTETRDRP